MNSNKNNDNQCDLPSLYSPAFNQAISRENKCSAHVRDGESPNQAAVRVLELRVSMGDTESTTYLM